MVDTPKVSIITPSYNQGKFIEETIQSVISQDYPNIEYIIIDGGSTDNTIEIIRRYEDKIAFWISENDGGQAHAINKGLQIATGDLMAWLNSDDTYEPGAIKLVVNEAKKLESPFILTGYSTFFDQNGIIWKPKSIAEPKGILKEYSQDELLRFWKSSLSQPSTFWSKETFEKLGTLNNDLYFALDLDYWLRGIQNNVQFYLLPIALSKFRYHSSSKTLKDQKRLISEVKDLSNAYLGEIERKKFDKDLKRYTRGLMVLKELRDNFNYNRELDFRKLAYSALNDPSLLIKYFSIYRSLLYRYLFSLP